MNMQSWREHFTLLSDGESGDDWRHAGEGEAAWVVLEAAPQDVTRTGTLPAEGVLSQAPLGDYDVIELSVFAKPAARIRWRYDDEEGGAIGDVVAVGGVEISASTRAALVEAALDELWQEGGERVWTVIPEAQAPDYLAAGWEQRERVTRD